MGLFEAINQLWLNFLNIFPPQYHGIITSIVLIALIISFISLFFFNPLIFIIVLIVTLPILVPIIITFLGQINAFVSGVTGSGGNSINAPKP